MDKSRLFFVWMLFTACGISGTETKKCQQEKNCKLPNCFCATFNHPFFNVSDIPQMVYFGFDDALTPLIDPYYKKLFRSNRTNPNGCSIGMTLFVSNQYTSYQEVKYFYNKGMEIASHSVQHGHIKTEDYLYQEAKQQKQNLAQLSGIPESDIIGWRSPFLETAGDHQPDVLQKLGYKYDISLTYKRGRMREPNPWPFTADYGWPFHCQMVPCLSKPHPGFWEFPVNSMIDFKDAYPCNYVDGCMNRPGNEHEAFQYLMDNFKNAYDGNRAPFGIHMHAGWFLTKYNYKAMDRFIQEILTLPNVYIVTVKQVLEWMKSPVPLSDIQHFTPWQCRTWPSKVTHHWNWNPRMWSSEKTHEATKQLTTARPTVPSSSTKSATLLSTPAKTIPISKLPTMKSTTLTSTETTTTPTTKLLTKKFTTSIKQSVSREEPYIKSTKHLSQPKTPSAAGSFTSGNSHNSVSSTTPRMIKPVTSSASTNNFNWSWMWSSLFNKPKSVPANIDLEGDCIQGLNCKLPDCFCEGNKNPGELNIHDTPQFVYILFDGDIESRVFSKYRKIFSGERRNPNNCPISSTFFVSQKGSRDEYISYLHNKGQEIAMRGSSSTRISNIVQLNEELSSQKGEMYRTGIPVFGWRSPELKPLGDEQYSALVEHRLQYDSTLVLKDNQAERQWPFTLDFGWKDHCVISECPQKRYPGLWEVPNIPVKDYRNMYPCNYVDGCIFSPRSAEETFQFLWNNFQRSYTSNKAPFGINLRHVWFTHIAYRNNVKGFEMFLDRLGRMEDVYVVSIEKLIKWMKRPIPLSDMKLIFHC